MGENIQNSTQKCPRTLLLKNSNCTTVPPSHSVIDAKKRCIVTLVRTGEQHLRLQPGRPISIHHSGSRGVGQADEILSLLLLHRIRSTERTNNMRLCNLAWESVSLRWRRKALTLCTSRGMTYLRTSGWGASMAAFFTSSQLALRLANQR